MDWSWSFRIDICSCGLEILAILQDVLQRCVCNGVEVYGLFTGPLNPGITISFGKVDDSHADCLSL